MKSTQCLFTEEGQDASRVLEEIHSACGTYQNRHILNSICTEPLDIAKLAYMEAISTNLGDPRLFPDARNIEINVMKKLGELLGLPGAVGNAVSGGTEANLLAMYAAKKRGEERNISSPEVVAPESIHFSVVKAANLLGIRLKLAELDDNFRAIPSSVNQLITENTVAVFVTAGTSETGAIDPIAQIAYLCEENDIYLHVDAASGGYIIPFAKELGYELPEFDFSINGVHSITVDPHKYGLSVIPSGFILFRDERLQNYMNFESFFIHTPNHRTFSGTRTGAGVISVYAVMEHLGHKGFRAMTRHYFKLKDHLIPALTVKGLEILCQPDLNIVMIKSKDPIRAMEELEQRGWYVSVSKRCHAIRVVLHQHNYPDELSEFAEILHQIEIGMCM
ncbi:tyrosine decarboxylase MfnA [Paenibacillus sp. NPDC057934]|uniref:tyrosine decarboxylase MfnA n=1 Tax=Paenibacillus sp. NPDC057934 TaxID=3346282 RepID=UPI0036DE1FE0